MGEERIANELLVKLGIRVSPRTVRKYMPKRPPGQPRGDQRWSTFLKNHAKAILACDFFVAVTATFRMLYVFVVIEHGTRRLAHINVTAHPSAEWTLQQLREVIGNNDDRHKYLIHDRDRIFATDLDDSIKAVGIEVLRSPFASPKANSLCEPERVPLALAAAVQARADGLLVTPSPLNVSQRKVIADFAMANRLPSISGDKGFVWSGGLMSYWTDWEEVQRRSATYVDKILKGAKPGDLPVEQPTKFELVINVKTAKALGLTIPQSLLLRADEVIQ